MKYIILFLVAFTVIFVLYLLTVILNKRKLAKFPKSSQALLLINRFKLKIDKDNVKEFALKVACVNSFIIATALVVIEFVNSFILKLLVATLIMIPLIIILYYLVAKSMKKEGK